MLLFLICPERRCQTSGPEAGLMIIVSKHSKHFYLNDYGGRCTWKADHRREEGPQTQETWPPGGSHVREKKLAK